MEPFDVLNLLPATGPSYTLEEFLSHYPEAAFSVVQFLSEEIQMAYGELRMVWEGIPAGSPVGRA